MTNILETVALTRDFGAFRAVDGVNLQVRQGSLHSLIGPNGAGKTTLFNCISAVLKPTAGRVRYDGRDITNMPLYISTKDSFNSFAIITDQANVLKFTLFCI